MLTKGLIFFLLPLLALGAGQAYAATQTIAAHMAFETTLSLTNVSGIDLGFLKAGQAGTYTIAPNNVVTASNGGVVLGGTNKAGSLTIAGSTSQAIDIAANNYVANNGVTPSNATCSYGGSAAAPCALTSQAAAGAGKVLLIGVTVDADGHQAPSTTASPTFDIVVTYH